MSLVNGDLFDDAPLEAQIESGWIEDEEAAIEYVVAQALETLDLWLQLEGLF